MDVMTISAALAPASQTMTTGYGPKHATKSANSSRSLSDTHLEFLELQEFGYDSDFICRKNTTN